MEKKKQKTNLTINNNEMQIHGKLNASLIGRPRKLDASQMKKRKAHRYLYDYIV